MSISPDGSKIDICHRPMWAVGLGQGKKKGRRGDGGRGPGAGGVSPECFRDQRAVKHVLQAA